MLTLSVPPDELKSLVASVISETLAAIQSNESQLGDRWAFSEPEAARLLSMKPHQLRDERLRGRIGASGVVGKGIRYTRQDLLGYLARERTEPRI